MFINSASSQIPVEKAQISLQVKPPVTPLQIKNDTNDICKTPQNDKKVEIPYPEITKIEGKVDKSFKETTVTPKEAKDRMSSVMPDSNGDNAGMVSSNITSKPEMMNFSMNTLIEGKSVLRLTDPLRNKK